MDIKIQIYRYKYIGYIKIDIEISIKFTRGNTNTGPAAPRVHPAIHPLAVATRLGSGCISSIL